MYLSMLMLVPVLIGITGLFTSKGKITWKEFLCMEGLVLIVLMSGFAISRYNATADLEIWSGRITSKEQTSVPCSHSYSCNCHESCSGSGRNQSCSEVCSTCYRHSNDYDWDLQTNIGSTITIDRIDGQGVLEPRRWTKAFINEPVVVQHSFKNYIKANPGTVLLRRGMKDVNKLPVPNNPVEVYDYYRVNRFLAVGYGEPHAKDWNWLLDELNATYGSRKQVNVIVVAVKTTNPDYAYLLEQQWLGGKKNDLVVVLGISDYPKIAWVHIMSWSKAEDMKVEMRDAILEIGTMEKRNDIMAAIENGVKTKWQRRHMKEFEYLMAGVEPGPTGTIILFLIGTLMTIGLAFYFWKHDPFGDDIQPRFRSGYRSNLSSADWVTSQFDKFKHTRKRSF